MEDRIWSIDCSGEVRAGMIGDAEILFNVGADRQLRSSQSAFVAPKSRRTVRKRDRGMHVKVVPVNVKEIESRKAMKKMLKKAGSKARRN